MANIETLFETQWIGVYRIGHWDFVRRPKSPLTVGILAITDENEIILVEQFRVPLQQRCIEFPAGIVGDEPEFPDETTEHTAGRELLEETGYRASKLNLLTASPTTPGMSSEFMHIYHATGLVKEHDGGGIGSEDITVHKIPLKNFRTWITERQTEGYAVDCRLFASLWLAGISA